MKKGLLKRRYSRGGQTYQSFVLEEFNLIYCKLDNFLVSGKRVHKIHFFNTHEYVVARRRLIKVYLHFITLT